ncbi:MAG: hypothetical protein J2P25_20235 [Nocardiopsaceae bacterium]|nr:hypothetical protein [Nocardiopsaceae bacterium]
MSKFNEAQYREIISKIEEGISKVVSEYNTCASRLEHDLGWIPLVGDGIKEGLEKIGKLLEEVVQQANRLLAPHLIPIDMWNWSSTWERVANAAAKVASGDETRKGLTSLQGDENEWGGIAGGKYKATVGRQENAVELIQARADSISNACGAVTQCGVLFYIAGLAATASLVGAVIAFASAASPAAPAAIPSFIIAIGAFLVSTAGAIASLEYGVDNQARTFKMATQVTDSIPRGKWPTSANS